MACRKGSTFFRTSGISNYWAFYSFTLTNKRQDKFDDDDDSPFTDLDRDYSN